MKRLFCLILSMVIVLSMFAGCGNDAVASESPASAPETVSETVEAPAEEATEQEPPVTEESTDGLEAIGEVEVDQNLFNVEVTIPAEYLDEGTTQESLDQAVNDMGYKSATLNPDGSVTYVITKQQHTEMMEGVKESIDTGLEELLNSDEYTFVSIEANEDYTEFTATVSGEELGLGDVFAGMLFYLYGGMYNSFNGTPVDNVCVTYISEATGEVIEVANSSDAG